MADDGVIRIGTEVDISGIKANMAEAAAAVKTSTSQMEAAYKQLASTTAEYAVTQANLRAVIRQLVDGQVPYALAVKALTPALMEQSTATKALQAAKAQLAAEEAEATAQIEAQNAALTSNTLAQTAAAVAGGELAASQSMVTASARLAGRELGGSVGGQLGMIAARSSLLGPILSSPFLAAAPIIAGVGIVVYQLGSKIAEMRKQAEEAANSIDIAFRRMSDEIRASNDTLITQADRLQEELDKLTGRPGQNGMAVAFDEAASAADKLGASIDRDIDKMRQLVDLNNNKKNSIGFWASFWSGKGETTDTQKTIDTAISGIQEMNDSYARTVASAAASGDKGNLAQAEEARLAGLQTAYQQATDKISGSLDKMRHAQDVYEESGKIFGKDQTANIKLLQGALDALALEQQNIGEQYRNEQLQQKVIPARGAHEADGAADKAARKQLQDIEFQFESLSAKESSLKGHGLTAGEGLAFWGQYLTTFKAGSEEAKHVLDEYVKAQEDFHKRLEAIKAETKKGASEDVHMEGLGPELTKWINQQADDVLKTGDKWREYRDAVDKASEAMAKITADIQLAKVKAGEASGTITKLGADQQTAAIHAAEYTARLKALNEELERLKKEGTYDALGNNIDPKNAAQQVQVKSQIGQVTGQAQVSGIQDQAAIQQQIAQPYLKAFDSINQGWMQVQNRMFYSTRNLSLEFAKMGQSIFISIVDNMEKAALVALEKELVMALAHTSAVAQRVATDASGAAASTAISKSAAMEQGIQAAKLAFKNTYATVSQWPVVGPALAPVLASAAFVAVAAFEDGTGYVPRDGMAYLHEGEAVVPAPTVEELRGSSGSGDLHIHNTNNVNAPTEKAILRALDRNPHLIAVALKRHLRQAGKG